jgi:DNA-binding HxlR family transcriptional regulator
MQNKLGIIYDSKNCPVRQVLDRIGDKWSTLVILQLGENEVMRFNELSQAIGDISQKMLTTTVRNLEADGLISRKMYAEIPPKVEYRLTALGASLLPLIRDMVLWADSNIRTIQRNRARNSAISDPVNRARSSAKPISHTADRHP